MSEPNIGFFPLPNFAPAYPEPPSTFTGNTAISLLCRASAGTLERLVPAPLTVIDDHFLINWSLTKDVRGTHSPETPFLSDVYVIEFVAAVEYKGERGGHCFLEYTTPAESAMIGREIWGWPKKASDFVWENSGDSSHVEVIRRGVKLIETDFTIIDEESLPRQEWPEAFNEPYLHVRHRVGRNGDPSYADILRVPVEELSSEPTRRGIGTINMMDGPGDPVASALGSIEVLDARLYRNEFIFHYGDIIETIEIPHPRPQTPDPLVSML